MMKGGSDRARLQQTAEHGAALDCSYVDTRVDVGNGHSVSHKNGAESGQILTLNTLKEEEPETTKKHEKTNNQGNTRHN